MTIPPWGAAVLPAVMSLCLSCYWWVCCFFALLMVLDHRCMVLLLFSADWLLRIQYSSAHVQTMPTSAPKLLNNLLQPIRMAESIVCLKQLVCVCKLFIKIHPRNVGLDVKPYVWHIFFNLKTKNHFPPLVVVFTSNYVEKIKINLKSYHKYLPRYRKTHIIVFV